MTNTIAEIAANWWAEQIINPEININKTLFAAALIPLVNAKLLEENGEICLKTDYDPDELLWEALELAGADMPLIACDTCRIFGLPYKTRMKINGGIIVSEGRGAPYRSIL